ncbi:MAG: hypothetical protein NTW86_15870 [Candidatus Sumerlaeota bacterium]|nr:hypothetical protein [Candidatus Sumerlaeota bacterium]
MKIHRVFHVLAGAALMVALAGCAEVEHGRMGGVFGASYGYPGPAVYAPPVGVYERAYPYPWYEPPICYEPPIVYGQTYPVHVGSRFNYIDYDRDHRRYGNDRRWDDGRGDDRRGDDHRGDRPDSWRPTRYPDRPAAYPVDPTPRFGRPDRPVAAPVNPSPFSSHSSPMPVRGLPSAPNVSRPSGNIAPPSFAPSSGPMSIRPSFRGSGSSAPPVGFGR